MTTNGDKLLLLCEQDDFLIFDNDNDCESGSELDFKSDDGSSIETMQEPLNEKIKYILYEYAGEPANEALIEEIYENVIKNGMGCLSLYRNDLPPKYFNKLKHNLNMLIPEFDKRKIKFNLWSNELNYFNSLFDTSAKPFHLKDFIEFDYKQNGTCLSDQFKALKVTYTKNDLKEFQFKFFQILFGFIKTKVSLKHFVDSFKNAFTGTNIRMPSQRLLVYYMLKNCDFELRSQILSFIYVSNPVPLLNPATAQTHEIQSDVYWVIGNVKKPVYLSFGIDTDCKGKTGFVNEFLLTDYEQNEQNDDSIFFNGTIDIQFNTSSPCDIADTHGSILTLNEAQLDRVTMLFDGFLVHLNDMTKDDCLVPQLIRLLQKLVSHDSCKVVYVLVQPTVEFSLNYDFLCIDDKIEIIDSNKIDEFREHFYKQVKQMKIDVPFSERFECVLSESYVKRIKRVMGVKMDDIDYAQFKSILLSEYNMTYLMALRNSSVDGHERVCGVVNKFVKNEDILNAYKDIVLNGDVFEVFNGESMNLNSGFLFHLFKLLSIKVKVISVVGPKSSGKSTVVNSMFNTRFNAHSTTKGIYASFVKVNKATDAHCDYYLILDTQGVDDSNKQQMLFCLAVSNIILVCVKQELSTDLYSLLEYCFDSLKQIKTVFKPKVCFIFNQQQQTVEPIQTNPVLNQYIGNAETSYKTLPLAYNTQVKKVGSKFLTHFELSQEFIEKSAQITVDVLESCDSQSISINKWLECSNVLFGLLSKYKCLTQLKRMADIEQNNRLVEWIRQQIEVEFKYEQFYLDGENVNETFYLTKNRMINEFNGLCVDYNVTAELKEANLKYLHIQIKEAYNACLRLNRIKKQEMDVKNLIGNLSGSLSNGLKSFIEVNGTTDVDEIKRNFNVLFEQMYKDASVIANGDDMLFKNLFEYLYSIYSIFEKKLCKIDYVKQFSNLTFSQIHTSISDLNVEDFFVVNELPPCDVEKFKILNNSQINQMFSRCHSNMVTATDCLQNGLDCNLDEFGLKLQTYMNSDFKLNLFKIKFLPLKEIYDENLVTDFLLNFQKSSSNGHIYSFCEYVRTLLTTPNIRLNSAKEVLDWTYLFETLIKETVVEYLSNCDGPFGFDVLKTVIKNVKQVLVDLNGELSVFGLGLSLEATNCIHQYVFKIMHEFYFDSIQKPILSNLTKLKNERENLFQLFLSQLLPNTIEDVDGVRGILNGFEACLNEHFKMNAKVGTVKFLNENGGVLSRVGIQQTCDLYATCTKDTKWLFDYVTNPIETLICVFNQKWLGMESQMNYDVLNSQRAYVNVFHEVSDKFKDLMKILNNASQHSKMDLFVVNNLFEIIETGVNGNSSVYVKGLATSKFLFDYLMGSTQPVFEINGFKLKINLNSLDLKYENRPLNQNTRSILVQLENVITSYTINNLRFVLVGLIENLKLKQQEFFHHAYTVYDIDEHLYDTYLDRIRNCGRLCPCCGKPCDYEHFKDPHDLRHRCTQSGHQFRGMYGFTIQNTKKPSFKLCEEMCDGDFIVIENGKKLTWAEYKQLHSDWIFESRSANIDLTNNWKFKCCHIWSQIGMDICKHYQMDYTELNSSLYNMETTGKATHFILALDSSTSMYGHKWQMLMSSVEEFLTIRSTEGSPRDVITILNFGSDALEVVKKSCIHKELIEKIEYIGYHTTYFSILLQKIIEIMKEHYNDSDYLFSIVLMSDGKPTFIESEYDIMDKVDCLSQAYNSRLHKFWSIGFGDYSNFTILRKMAEKFAHKGKFLNSDVNDESLLNVYTEIARETI